MIFFKLSPESYAAVVYSLIPTLWSFKTVSQNPRKQIQVDAEWHLQLDKEMKR